jgi:hypothetical protein
MILIGECEEAQTNNAVHIFLTVGCFCAQYNPISLNSFRMNLYSFFLCTGLNFIKIYHMAQNVYGNFNYIRIRQYASGMRRAVT